MSDPAAELTRWLHGLGWSAVAILPLSEWRDPRRPRAVFRAVLADGGSLKVRRLEHDRAARRQERMRRGVPPGFAPVLARQGEWLVEPWIEGESPPARRPDVLRRGGALLAALHATPWREGRSLVSGRPAARWRRDTVRRLDGLRRAGVLAEPVAAALVASLHDEAPGPVRCGRVHHDFCGDNIVIDGGGRLHAIDNERMGIDALGMDLARTWYRWDLAGPWWREFRAGYESGGGGAVFGHARFWRICAVASSAAIRLRMGDPGLSVPLEVLHGLTAEEEDS